MKRIFITLISLALIITGCNLVDPITRAQSLSKKGRFADAINILENEYKKQPNSVPVKSLLAQAYSDYGLALCQDTNKPPRIKYPMAKEQFAMAIALNPYLTDAKDMYKMIEKIQESFRNNNVN